MKIIAMTVLMGVATFANAQNANQTQPRERKESAPIAQNADELAKQLDITPETAEKAWPIYAEYAGAKKASVDKRKEESKSQKANKDARSDEDIDQAFYSRLKSQHEALDMEEAYYKKFRAILSGSDTMRIMRQVRMAQRDHKPNNKRQSAPMVPQDRMSK